MSLVFQVPLPPLGQAVLFRICNLVKLITRAQEDHWCPGAESHILCICMHFSLPKQGLKVGESQMAGRNGQ